MKLLLPLAALAVTSQALPGSSCIDLAKAITKVNAKQLVDETLSKVCEKGDLGLSDGPELIDECGSSLFPQLAQEAGATNNNEDDSLDNVAGLYKSLATELFGMAATKCSTELPSSGSVCEALDKATAFIKCIQRGTWPLMMRKAHRILPLLKPGMCKGHAELLNSGKLVGEMLPEQLERFMQGKAAGR